jgi:hypothetical protein
LKAESEAEAWQKLDEVEIVIPDNVSIDIEDCEILEIGDR